MYYIIDKPRRMITAQHETEALCRQHILNSTSLFGGKIKNYEIVKGAKERDRKMKELKNAPRTK